MSGSRRRRVVRQLSSRALCRLLAGRRSALPADPGSILVIRPDSRLGNLVLLEPLLRSLVERFPRARVALVASDRFSAILSGREWEVIAPDKAAMARNPARFAAFARRIRRECFEVAVDASHPFSFSLSGAVMSALSGAPARIGFTAAGWGDWHTHTAPEPSRGDHESFSLHSLGGVWERWPAWSRPLLRVKRPEPPRRVIGLHVGASRGKFYPVGKLARLAGLLSAIAPVEVYWGSRRERDVAEALEGPGITAAPPSDVTALAERLAGLSVLVTPDNGPMHVASAAGVPVVALFRVDNRARFSPLSDGSVVLLDPEGPDPCIAAAEAGRILG